MYCAETKETFWFLTCIQHCRWGGGRRPSVTGNVAGFAHNCLFCILYEKAGQFEICPKILLGCAHSLVKAWEVFFNNPDHLPTFISLEQHTDLILQ